ncbi:MAG TPA: sensor histidine kinase N-terminal domain-containing protein [Noviherbaspirillum sp.]|nr:sensor histidine kinase N-terminal domain-containing protein [Noviherbaspirillum sp.]
MPSVSDAAPQAAGNAHAPLPDASPALPAPLPTKPQERVQRSLFGEILDWMLVPLLLLWPMSIAITYLVAKSIANQPFDRALEDRTMVLAQQVKEVDGRIATRLSASAREILRADEVDQVHYQILGSRGELADGDRDLPLPPQQARVSTTQVQFRNDVVRGNEVRVAWMHVDLRHDRSGRAVLRDEYLALVQVAETLEKRAHLANEVIKGVILPQFVILPIALALVWLALARGLTPLAEIQRRIRERRPDDLSPIETGQVPEEIAPLVHSFNDMLGRLSQSIEMQKRFIADAAHQMKTPLAGMRTQAELALRESDPVEVRRSLVQLAKSSETAARMVNQLLALARAENASPATKPFHPLELRELARAVVQDWVQTSFAQRIDLGYEQPDHPVTIVGNPVMLREMLSNLIDNALHYTPSGGSVTVRIGIDALERKVILEVEDTGPGIPAAERSRVFERFYRILGSNVDGSGLGLAIVREIVQQHGATVQIHDNPHSQDPRFPGTLIIVLLPLFQRPALTEDIG